MASTKRKSDAGLKPRQEWIDNQADRSLFGLIRTLERVQAYSFKDQAENIRIGSDTNPDKEPVRFHAVNHFGFAAKEVDRVHLREADKKHAAEDLQQNMLYDIDVNIMGLTGRVGVLPQHYTRLIQERNKVQDYALSDFLDLFNHRLISLYYRAWAKYRIASEYEHYQRQKKLSPFTRALQSLAGRSNDAHYEVPLYYSGHFSKSVRSTRSLELIIQDYFGYPVSIKSFCGNWLPIKKNDRFCIGVASRGRNNLLGDGVLLGDKVWDVQSKCEIEIGPITHEEYETVLPDTQRFKALSKIVRDYAPAHLAIELHYVVNDPQGRAQQPLGKTFKLGWNSWLGSDKPSVRHSRIKLR